MSLFNQGYYGLPKTWYTSPTYPQLTAQPGNVVAIDFSAKLWNLDISATVSGADHADALWGKDNNQEQ